MGLNLPDFYCLNGVVRHPYRSKIAEAVAGERSGHTAVADAGYVYVWGGYVSIAEHGVFYPSDEIWLYDVDSGIWQAHPMEGDAPPPMSGTCGCSLNGEMYIFGGYNDNGYTNQLYCVNLRSEEYTWKKVSYAEGCQPTPRDKNSCWVYNDRIIYFGGYGCKRFSEISDSTSFTVDEVSWVGEIFWGWNNEVHVFDPQKLTWSEPSTRGVVPAPRAAHACATLHNKGYVCGGRVVNTRTSDIHCLDLDTWTWSEIIHTSAQVPAGRSWHTLTPVADSVLFLFGGLSANCEPLSDSWTFNTHSREWREMKHLQKNTPRLWHTACQGKGSEVIVFGGSQDDLLSVDTGHCNDILVFQTQPCSLVRLCEDCIGKNSRVLNEQLSWLPLKLRQAIQKRILFFEIAEKSTRKDNSA
nr:PREDICTED: kelch domain-containing protein 1 isoform X2 [Lepisosteus oculatus]